jgi:hypothetical protein
MVGQRAVMTCENHVLTVRSLGQCIDINALYICKFYHMSEWVMMLERVGCQRHSQKCVSIPIHITKRKQGDGSTDTYFMPHILKYRKQPADGDMLNHTPRNV